MHATGSMAGQLGHAYFECESYVEERRLLFHAALAHHSSLTSLDVEKQMALLCSRNPSIIMSVSKFVYACLLKHNILVNALISA